MSPTFNRSSVIQHFKGSDAIEICDGITINFYIGLPHILFYCSVGIMMVVLKHVYIV